MNFSFGLLLDSKKVPLFADIEIMRLNLEKAAWASSLTKESLVIGETRRSVSLGSLLIMQIGAGGSSTSCFFRLISNIWHGSCTVRNDPYDDTS